MKIGQVLLGIFIGWVIGYNVFLHDVGYRISYYGYAQKDGQTYPIIKLRKLVKSSAKQTTFHPRDWGVELEVGNFVLKSSRTEFDDKMIDEIIKKRYCHD